MDGSVLYVFTIYSSIYIHISVFGPKVEICVFWLEIQNLDSDGKLTLDTCFTSKGIQDLVSEDKLTVDTCSTSKEILDLDSEDLLPKDTCSTSKGIQDLVSKEKTDSWYLFHIKGTWIQRTNYLWILAPHEKGSKTWIQRTNWLRILAPHQKGSRIWTLKKNCLRILVLCTAFPSGLIFPEIFHLLIFDENCMFSLFLSWKKITFEQFKKYTS